MRRLITKILILVFILSVIFKPESVLSLSCEDSCDDKSGSDKLDCLSQVKQACEEKLAETTSKKKTLQSAVNMLNNEIAYTQSRINQTQYQIEQLQDEINELSDKIFNLNISLEQITKLFMNRVETTYKQSRVHPLVIFFTADGFSDFINRFSYLKAAQKNDRSIMIKLEETKVDYANQKALKKEKQDQVLGLQTELVNQKKILANQQNEKQNLLVITKNDEAKYQDLIEQAAREIESLANSEFVSKKHVTKGEIVGIMGSTGFSTGPHLHFGYFTDVNESDIEDVYEWYFSRHHNPLELLQNQTLHVESGACHEFSGSTSIGNGSLAWPMNNTRITQCYGNTPFSSVYPDNFHRGLDMSDNGDIAVRAVNDGEAYFYRSTSSFGNNVRIIHPDGKMTLYLHLK